VSTAGPGNVYRERGIRRRGCGLPRLPLGPGPSVHSINTARGAAFPWNAAEFALSAASLATTQVAGKTNLLAHRCSRMSTGRKYPHRITGCRRCYRQKQQQKQRCQGLSSSAAQATAAADAVDSPHGASEHWIGTVRGCSSRCDHKAVSENATAADSSPHNICGAANSESETETRARCTMPVWPRTTHTRQRPTGTGSFRRCLAYTSSR
jgi:hypothetical protein